MEGFFNEVVIFLEDYYVYVIGVGLIVILMLIGLLASKRKAKKAAKDNESMANINDVNTGSIKDVADTLQNNVMQPVDVVNFAGDNAPVASEENVTPSTPEVASTPAVESAVAEPVAPIATPISSNIATPVSDVATPVNDVATPVSPIATPVEASSNNNATVTVQPIVEETNPSTVVTPVDEDKFDKTEVIDFSSFDGAKPVTEPVTPVAAAPATPVVEPVKPAEVTPTNFTPFVVDKSQYNDSNDDSILN